MKGETPIIDSIMNRIDCEYRSHQNSVDYKKPFKPSDIVLLPEEYIDFLKAWTPRYGFTATTKGVEFMGAAIRVEHPRKAREAQNE